MSANIYLNRFDREKLRDNLIKQIKEDSLNCDFSKKVSKFINDKEFEDSFLRFLADKAINIVLSYLNF